VVKSNPFYHLTRYNCQNFVNDLRDKLSPSGSRIKTARRFIPWWAKAYLERAPNIAIAVGYEISEQFTEEHNSELAVFESLIAEWDLQEDFVADVPMNQISDDDTSPSEELFCLKDQTYLLDYFMGDDLTDIALAYEQTGETPVAFEMAGIEITDEFDPDDLTDEDKERLEVAALLAGEPYI
jgi:hypothetical protein